MWTISNLCADNDPTYPALAMRISADVAVFYNPVTKCAEGETINTSALANIECAINGGPAAGFRDQAAPYVAGNVVWFYLIYNSVTGAISSLNSLTGPATVDSAGLTGPTLPPGFTSYCPCFPVIMVASATLMPLGPKSGYSNIQVRGNEVQYPNRPLILGGSGYPVMNFDLSGWIPPCALETAFLVDAEIHSSAAGGVIGGLVISMTGIPNSALQNISLYPTGPSVWVSQDDPVRIGLSETGQKFTATFEDSGGVIDNAVCDIFVIGYSFQP